MDLRSVQSDDILQAVQTYGPAGGAQCIRKEVSAAQDSSDSGLYITWIPREFGDIRNEETREMYETRHQQCCRVGRGDVCLCGHSLSDHKPVNERSKSYIIPPKCMKKGCRCFAYNYAPTRPEETGQWWLPRRKDFDVRAWRKVSYLLAIACQSSVIRCFCLVTLYQNSNHDYQSCCFHRGYEKTLKSMGVSGVI